MTTNKRNNLNRCGLLLGGCLFVPVLVALLLGAGNGGNEGSRLAQHRQEIEQMTPAQRAQLDRNYRAFLEMSPELQQRYRELHLQLQAAENAEALRITLDRYRNWLKTLSPFQRDDLRAITDLDERVDRVRELKAEQASPEPLSDEDPRLSREDLAAMINAIADDLSIASAELDGKSEWQRSMFVLNSLAESKRDQLRFRDWSSMFDDRLMSKMITALPVGEFRVAITDIHRFKSAERKIVAGNIVEFLGRDLEKSLEDVKPSEVEMKRLAQRMSLEDRRRYGELASQDEREQFIHRRYRRLRMYDKLQPYPALRPLFFQRAAFRRGEELRGNSFPRRGGRDPERGGPNGQRPFPPQGPLRGFRPGDTRRPGPERPVNRE
jgi:hypothetical protein